MGVAWRRKRHPTISRHTQASITLTFPDLMSMPCERQIRWESLPLRREEIGTQDPYR